MTAYRKSTPYRKAQGYRGLSTGPMTPPPTRSLDVRAPWAVPAGRDALQRMPFADPTARADTARLPWSADAPQSADSRLPITHADQHDATARAPYRDAPEQMGAESSLPFAALDTHDRVTAMPWADTTIHASRTARLRWLQETPHARTASLPWGTLAPHSTELSALWRTLAARGALVALPWGQSGSHSHDTRAPYPVDPDPTDPGGSPITVPYRPVYIMIPTLTAVLLPGETPIDMLSCSIGRDLSQSGWRFSATITRDALALVSPAGSSEPAQIRVTVCGYAWTLAVESYSDNRRFGQRTATITGASRLFMLAAPYAPLRTRLQTEARNASQLAAEELGDGLSLPETGWTLVWDAVDWLVPGGTWSYADQSPLDAITQIAASIGARVEADRALLQLAVRPMCEISPWAWDAAEPWAIIPASILSQGDGRWSGGSNATGVYVSSGGGYLARVTVAGSGGTVTAGMVTDRLLTTADPARERGRQVLAAAGRIKVETITIPLFPSPADPGLLPIGKLIDVQESPTVTWRGQVMGVRIDANREGSAFTARQTLTIERQFR